MFNFLREWIAYLFLGCPICYNIIGIVRNERKKEGYCPKCNNTYSYILWKK